MDELDAALSLALTGEEASRALAEMRAQVQQWGLVLPNEPPFVCDFGLGDFRHTGEIEVWIANEVQAGYCGKFLFVFDGQTCPSHSHRTKHETFFIVKGRVEMACGKTVSVMEPGDVLPAPPGTVHRFTGIGPALLLEVSMPCVIGDNWFEDHRIPIGGNYRENAPNPDCS